MSGKRGKGGGKRGKGGRRQHRALKLGAALALLAGVYSTLAVIAVHHPREWLEDCERRYPAWLVGPFFATGEFFGDLTDALGLTGEDAVYEYDLEPPTGSVLFAGAPRRVGAPAPDDITVLNRGEFLIGWSPSLRHPVWCAYHVPVRARYSDERKNFARDRSVASAPLPGDYAKSGYDRGHLVPNHAIATRFGEAMQKQTFLMSNIAPQTPQLNRGVWRNLEHRIADLWPQRWGEIWVIVGATGRTGETVSGTSIDVPERYYQVVVAQSGMDVRAFAVLFDQQLDYDAYPTRHLVSIDALEELTGLDFLPELPEFIQSPLESERPTRLWPIGAGDIFRLLAIRYYD